jgi:hypothetical protein
VAKSNGYFKVNVNAYEHPQILPLSDAAFALWAKAGMWCVGNDLRFWTPLSVVKSLGYSRKIAQELALAGLWLSDFVDGKRGYWLIESDLWAFSVSDSRPSIPQWMRSTILERDGNACCYCGAPDDLQMDHIHPWSRGGATTVENLQALCGPCNRRKGARVEWSGSS